MAERDRTRCGAQTCPHVNGVVLIISLAGELKVFCARPVQFQLQIGVPNRLLRDRMFVTFFVLLPLFFEKQAGAARSCRARRGWCLTALSCAHQRAWLHEHDESASE